jgi:hypothetical protein
MTRDSNINIAFTAATDEISLKETSRLLLKLDQVIDHSTALRYLIRRRELLYDLENLSGSCPGTQTLRQEIASMEQQPDATREDADDAHDPPYPGGHTASN